MTRRSPVPAGAWPQHYTADDIAVATAAKAALAERRMTPIELATQIRGSTGSAYQVLAGTYKYSPTHYLRRIAAALGIPLPAAWANLPALTAPTAPTGRAQRVAPALGVNDDAARAWVLHQLRQADAANPMPVASVLEAAGKHRREAERALRALIDDRQVMTATVMRKGFRGQVVYPMGRVVGLKPVRKRVSITPSNHANSVHRGTFA
ncbi:MAG: hypothetical protein PHW25_14655 [Zoogloea sp.]|uniref:hypothetical protein n=1 Tax=Zoogloea sp. TaxID=49181 RepID=UPI002638B1E2|nr:hypothetical protein [Zoogloea sp.]MDD3328320.1 hypothetical protein [Zoogloea sp.]